MGDPERSNFSLAAQKIFLRSQFAIPIGAPKASGLRKCAEGAERTRGATVSFAGLQTMHPKNADDPY
jgi:hypothetical protein